MHGFIYTLRFVSMLVDYLGAAAHGAKTGKRVMFYLGGAGRPDLGYIVVDYIRAKPRAHSLRSEKCWCEGPKWGVQWGTTSGYK